MGAHTAAIDPLRHPELPTGMTDPPRKSVLHFAAGLEYCSHFLMRCERSEPRRMATHTDSRPSFEARARARAPQDDGHYVVPLLLLLLRLGAGDLDHVRPFLDVG